MKLIMMISSQHLMKVRSIFIPCRHSRDVQSTVLLQSMTLETMRVRRLARTRMKMLIWMTLRWRTMTTLMMIRSMINTNNIYLKVRSVFGRPFVRRFALCYRTVVLSVCLCCLSVCTVCLSVLSVCLCCLSVTLVYCGRMVGWIKMKLGMRVGLGLGHIVLDGDPSPLPQRHTPNFRPISVIAKWLDGSRCHLVGR